MIVRLPKSAQWRLLQLKLIIQSAAARTAMRWRIHRSRRPHNLPGELVVSLTSYEARFETLPLTLRALLCQTIKPDRIVLWVSYEDEAKLPKAVTRLKRYGLDIRVTDDFRSFKKIIPSLKAFPEAFIVTADDDVYYKQNWLADLASASAGRRNLIVCHQARKINIDPYGHLQPYGTWPYITEPEESSAVFPVGRGGILYPPSALAREVLNHDAFLELCPKADDVWLYWMGRNAGSVYRKIGRSEIAWDWPGTQKVALFRENLQSNLNDSQIDAVAKRYGSPVFRGMPRPEDQMR
ncbi:glycosyltransferase family 2 protein [Microvirga calopogonii]|uniref:glycosyltransferase family 2 protein n=1 Tax=Microvirga calopogonii TaxID=2078013 RepID=UPI000E0CD54F|nr:glycosyltransferase family 2 protein [Microvirga calopogonii]